MIKFNFLLINLTRLEERRTVFRGVGGLSPTLTYLYIYKCWKQREIDK